MVAIAARLSGDMLKGRLHEPARLFRFRGLNDIDHRWNRRPGLWVSGRIFRKDIHAHHFAVGSAGSDAVCLNVFMTFAWYGHLKFKASWLPVAVLVSWGIAFFEYWLAVPANRWGSAVYTAAPLKTMQEGITLSVFAGFSVLYLKNPLGWNQVIGLA